MDLFLRSGQDPFIMMSWRCKNLEEIVIHGYVLDPHNIVGISRLRGRTLKHLEVSMIDNAPTEANIDSFIEVIFNFFYIIYNFINICHLFQKRKSILCWAKNGNLQISIICIQLLAICP